AFFDRGGFARFWAFDRDQVASTVVFVLGRRRAAGFGHLPFLHPRVLGIGDQDVAFRIRRQADSPAEAELAFAGAGFTELAQVFAFFAELLPPRVPFVGDPDVAFGVDVDRVGAFELAVA